jgi:hypothetical protein
MAPPTLLRCFSDEHPRYPTERKAEMQARTVRPSSQTTHDQVPPRVLIAESVETWLRLAENFIYSTRARNNANLNYGHIPLTEQCSIATEHDVVKLSTLYIIHPVMIAINAKFPNVLTQYSESPAQPLRIDLTFNRQPSIYGPGVREVVMIMEYKRCWYIHEDEFANAMRDDLYTALEELDELRQWSTLQPGSNASWFVKQARAYAINTGCHYAALCDYEHLILIHFLDHESAEVTIVPRSEFRKALLGFLIAACRDRGMIIG